MSNSVRPHRRQPTRLPHPWDSPGKSTGVGCHCLLRVFPYYQPKRKKKALLISIIELLDKLSRLSNCHFPCSLPGSSVHGILQARILEGFAISSSRASSWPWDPGIEPTYLMSPALAGGFFTTRATWEGCFPRFLINCLMHCMNQIMFFEDRDIGMNA